MIPDSQISLIRSGGAASGSFESLRCTANTRSRIVSRTLGLPFSTRSTAAIANPDSTAMSMTVGHLQFGPVGSAMALAFPLDALCVIATEFKAQNNDISSDGAGV